MMHRHDAPRGRGAQAASTAAIDDSAEPTARNLSSSPGALVVGLAAFVSSIGLLLGGAMPLDPLSLPGGIPGVAVNHVAAASVDPGQNAAQATGDLHVPFTASDPITTDHRAGSVVTHDHFGAESTGPVLPGSIDQRRSSPASGDLPTQLARGTRSESVLLAGIEARRDDPRAMLLRTAVWSRERGRTSVRRGAPS
jgi:hypothetical protein